MRNNEWQRKWQLYQLKEKAETKQSKVKTQEVNQKEKKNTSKVTSRFSQHEMPEAKMVFSL